MGFTFVVLNNDLVELGRLAYNLHSSERRCAFVRKVLIIVMLCRMNAEKVGTHCRLEYYYTRK